MNYTPFTNKEIVNVTGNAKNPIDQVFHTLTKAAYLYADDNGTSGVFAFATTTFINVILPANYSGSTTLASFQNLNWQAILDSQHVYPIGSQIRLESAGHTNDGFVDFNITILSID